jgi:hemoglobin-like flavoprotein
MSTDVYTMGTGQLPQVAPSVMRLLASCTADLGPQQPELAEALYQRLLELLPEVATLAERGRPLSDRILHAVLYPTEPGRTPLNVATVVQQVGAQNYLDGLVGEHYNSVTHAVLHSAREVYRGEWSSALSSAWVEYLLWLRGHLLAGAEVQRARQEAVAAARAAMPALIQAAADRTPDDYQPPPVYEPAQASYGTYGDLELEPSIPPQALLDDELDHIEEEDEEETYSTLMTSMTLNSRRRHRQSRQ